MQQAEDYMLAHIDQLLALKDFYQALHDSRRPLVYGFQEVFGVNPVEYLKVQRLQRVWRSLQVAEPETSNRAAFGSVLPTGIAQRFGFWSMGHFARDYTTMLGEPPSETLPQGSCHSGFHLGEVHCDDPRCPP